MTLKEKVAEIDPTEISEVWEGGVWSCPSSYDYLECGSTVGRCPSDINGGVMTCEDCWNREYKEDNHAV